MWSFVDALSGWWTDTLSFLSHMTKGGVRTGNVILIYKCNKYPERYLSSFKNIHPNFFSGYFFTPRGFSHMAKNINGADMPTLTVFRMELQRITDMNLKVDPIITKYMEDRIAEIEEGSD